MMDWPVYYLYLACRVDEDRAYCRNPTSADARIAFSPDAQQIPNTCIESCKLSSSSLSSVMPKCLIHNEQTNKETDRQTNKQTGQLSTQIPTIVGMGNEYQPKSVEMLCGCRAAGE